MPIRDEPCLNRLRPGEAVPGIGYFGYLVVQQYLNPAAAGCRQRWRCQHPIYRVWYRPDR